MPGFLTGLLAKLAGLGGLTKSAIAAVTAALTMAVAGGATGVLPLPGAHSGPAAAVQGAVDQATAAVGSATRSLPPTMTGASGVPAASEVSATPPTGSSSTHASTGLAAPTGAAPAQPHAVPQGATPAIPALPAIPSCVADLIPTGATPPDPAHLVSQLPACILGVIKAHLPLDTIKAVVGSAKLPVDLVKCLSAAIGSAPTFTAGDLSSLARLLSACLPKGSVPGMGSIPGMGSVPGAGFFPAMGSVPGMASFPGFKSGR